MGLYLCVFDDDDEELEGVEVGHYSDFEYFRDKITNCLEDGVAGSKYPTLVVHSDCDGEWSVQECLALKDELTDISIRFKQMPAEIPPAEWQKGVVKMLGLKISNLYDSFIDVDGEPLLERLIQLCDIAIEHQLPIMFQ